MDVKVLGNGLKLLEKGMEPGFPPSSRLLGIVLETYIVLYARCMICELPPARRLVNPRSMAAEARVPMTLSSTKAKGM